MRSNPARNPQGGVGRLTNCFSEKQEDDAKAAWLLYAVAGLTAFGVPLEGGGVRAMITVNELLYAVIGRNVYVVSPTGTGTLIGGIPTDGPVYMEQNRRVPTQIGIVSGGFLFVINTSTASLTQVLDPDLPAPVSLSFLDGYGALPIADGRYFLTAIDDFTQIDGLDVGTAEAFPDPLVRSAVLERELVLFGTQSTEWHQDTGDADFPFTRVHATEIGCLAPDSVAKADTGSNKVLLWVAPDHTVRMMQGYSGVTVSNNEIEALIKTLHEAGGIDQLKGFAWADSGRSFYCLTCDAWSKVLDLKTQYWHDRQSYNLPRWRISCVVQFGSKLIAGDYVSGQLYIMGDNYQMEGDEFLVVSIVTPPVHAFPYPIKMNALYIDAARGVGLNTTDPHAYNPKMMISLSKDSGDSWSAERERPLGILGQKAKRIPPIYRLGTAGQAGAQVRIRISAPVERLVMSAAMDFDRLAP